MDNILKHIDDYISNMNLIERKSDNLVIIEFVYTKEEIRNMILLITGIVLPFAYTGIFVPAILIIAIILWVGIVSAILYQRWDISNFQYQIDTDEKSINLLYKDKISIVKFAPGDRIVHEDSNPNFSFITLTPLEGEPILLF